LLAFDLGVGETLERYGFSIYPGIQFLPFRKVTGDEIIVAEPLRVCVVLWLHSILSEFLMLISGEELPALQRDGTAYNLA
jgi:hypothetical protein